MFVGVNMTHIGEIENISIIGDYNSNNVIKTKVSRLRYSKVKCHHKSEHDMSMQIQNKGFENKKL
jgi:hypothetical protein